MLKTLETVFDGKVFHPIEPLALAPNTHIWVTIDTAAIAENTPYSFLKTARSLNLEGPPDWATHLDEYLYGGEPLGIGTSPAEASSPACFPAKASSP